MRTFFFIRVISSILIFLFIGSVISCNRSGDSGNSLKVEYFINPILDEGPDPYVYFHTDGYYYCMVTRGDRLQLWKSRSFTDLKDAETKEIWFPPEKGSNSCCIWAPELHFFDGTWFIYYSATDKSNPVDLYRFVHVLKNTSDNPFSDSWEDLGKIKTRYPGIDGHVFEYNGNRYFAYSPYVASMSGIFLAKLTSPTTIEKEVNLGLPIYDWEMTPPRAIMEGPQFLVGPKDKIFIIYSAGACWDDDYGLGLFSADKDSDLLDPQSWTRTDHQIFNQCPDSSVFGPGHNCFTKSPDGKEDWIVYHAKKFSSNECNGRSTRAQIFTWDENGFPVFGKPVSVTSSQKKPSGINQ